MGDSAYALQITQNLGYHERKTSVKLYRKLVRLLGILFHATHLSHVRSLVSTEFFFEAVAYALSCVGLQYLKLKPKQEKALASV